MNDSRGRRRISGAAVGALALMVAGCSTGTQKIDTPFVPNAAHPAPAGLPDPQSWVFVGRTAYVPGKVLQMTWHKPSPKDPNQWTESFQYEETAGAATNSWQHTVILKLRTTQQYLDSMKTVFQLSCPSGSITPITVADSELLMEMKSGGCPRFGAMDEIDYTRFGRGSVAWIDNDVEHIVYIVKSADMTPAQRQAGISAVTSFAPADAPP